MRMIFAGFAALGAKFVCLLCRNINAPDTVPTAQGGCGNSVTH